MPDDLRPAYIALVRHELRLPPGTDALGELAARLSPGDRDERPPARAPAVIRLKHALRTLHRGGTPEQNLDAFAADLRTLALLTDRSPLSGEALERLLDDVRAPARRRVARRKPRANVTPFRPRGHA